ncbi:MAG: glycoside hydrolase family 27 protein [Bacteroidetes bacterium]|nr:glycoside hydrolase family 27 protein [Bacteroidota bacterium]
MLIMKLKRVNILIIILICSFFNVKAQVVGANGKLLAPTPPMGWMTWNFFGENINEQIIKEMADAMYANGMVKAGYHYIMIDDGWQGGRDNKNNIIPDAKKFPSGIKALVDYLHNKGMKLGIYSDAANLTCAGYTASLHFEEQDAKTFAAWGVDYLKYDYCNAPSDSVTAKTRYKKMNDALRKSGRDIVFSICEWGERYPAKWANKVGGQLWRTTEDIRDSWKSLIHIINKNAVLNNYAGPGHWNDPDMLIVGLNGNKGPAGDLGGTGCTLTEYKTNMSLWCLMASPLIATNDVRNMNNDTKEILLNEELIAVNQDALGIQAERKITTDSVDVFIKPLEEKNYAIGILNKTNREIKYTLNFTDIGINEKMKIKDLWLHKNINEAKNIETNIAAHETKVYKLSKN